MSSSTADIAIPNLYIFRQVMDAQLHLVSLVSDRLSCGRDRGDDRTNREGTEKARCVSEAESATTFTFTSVRRPGCSARSIHEFHFHGHGRAR